MMNSVRGGMKSPAMEVPMYVLYGSVFVGSVIGVIRQIQDLVKWFWKKEKKENKEVAE